MARLFVLLAGFGLIFAFMAFAGGRFDTSAVQVTFMGGGIPTPDPSNFEGCGPSSFNTSALTGSSNSMYSAPKSNNNNSNCYAYLKHPDQALECDYNLGFKANNNGVIKRLRVKVAIMKQGKEAERHSVTVDSLVRPADSPYVSKSFRGACDAENLEVVEARAFVDGQETNLIATGAISSKGLMPLFSDFFVKIAPPTGA